MSAELPIACSLGAEELRGRLGEMSALGRAALVEARTSPTRAQLRFGGGGDVLRRVQTIAEAESRCCAFLTMCVSEQSGAILLTIDAPVGAETALAELVDAFRALA